MMDELNLTQGRPQEIDGHLVLGSREAFLERTNVVPGLRYEFDGLKLRWFLVNEQRYRELFREIGFAEATIERQVALVRSSSLAVDYEELFARVRGYKGYVDSLHGPVAPSFDAPVVLTFDTTLEAGASVSKDGDAFISISAGQVNFERWFVLRQLAENVVPHFDMVTNGGEFTIDVESQKMHGVVVEALFAMARVIVGSGLGAGGASRGTQFLTALEEFMHSADYTEFTRQMRSNWRVAEIFVLCHEIGHINHGHLKEVVSWRQGEPVVGQAAARRLERRRRMEFEADSYAIAHTAVVTAELLNKHYRCKTSADLMRVLVEADADPHRCRDFILPIVDLFTILGCGHRGVLDFQLPSCPYPSYDERVDYLFSGKAGEVGHARGDTFLAAKKAMTWITESHVGKHFQ